MKVIYFSGKMSPEAKIRMENRKKKTEKIIKKLKEDFDSGLYDHIINKL